VSGKGKENIPHGAANLVELYSQVRRMLPVNKLSIQPKISPIPIPIPIYPGRYRNSGKCQAAQPTKACTKMMTPFLTLSMVGMPPVQKLLSLTKTICKSYSTGPKIARSLFITSSNWVTFCSKFLLSASN